MSLLCKIFSQILKQIYSKNSVPFLFLPHSNNSSNKENFSFYFYFVLLLKEGGVRTVQAGPELYCLGG